ncbi:beta-L-arabinofuranosidase domain-containing protein [Gorillibacterium massiliense]|uniref:beta-L-arabinofuranosidase domain-containing protein n=1 Tax=Gorillibacterium massiliense TaxID=1280390 RepID=UPI0004B30AC0|nr:beta-L-arabinofuranosidase domain-containing protein [Gorillibacterium massiliense]
MSAVKSANPLKAFEYTNVALKNSHWKRQLDETIEVYLEIPNYDLLHIFRQQAGVHSDANGLAGWYGKNASTFGQKLGAFAKLYRVTGDYRLKEKALYLIEEWIRCADRSDNLYDHDTYVYDKLMGGFLDLYEYLGYEKLAKYMSRLTDFAARRFKRDIKRDGLQDHELWTNQMIEWYTLPENLYRAYQLTGDEKYKAFAELWDYDYLWDKMNSRDFHIGPRHAYSQVNSLSSAARAYETTKDERYLSAMKIAYDEITTHHIFATGGYGPAECLFTEDEGYLGDSLKSTWDITLASPFYTNFGGSQVTRNDTWGSCEISCCAWAVFKFCNYLLQYTGDAKYGDWVEKLLYNGTGGQLPIDSHGRVMYYANYFLDGAIKSVEDRRMQDGGEAFEWQCCTGTFPQDVAEYANMLYYQDETSLYISQYLPSKVKWTHNGVAVGVENYSSYPEESQVRLRISASEPVEFQLKLRVPSWAGGANRLIVNGEVVECRIVPGEWAKVNRVWQDGDLVEVEFPYSLYFKAVDARNPDIVALNYGPLVLVADKMTQFIGDVDHPEDWIHPVESEAFTFITDKGHVAGYDFLTRRFTPYYTVGEMTWYYMYNRIHS